MIPNHYICPISQQIFLEPVLCQDGQIYEKQMIQKWIEENPTSPITRQPITSQFIDCHELKYQIQQDLILHPEWRQQQFVKTIEIQIDIGEWRRNICFFCSVVYMTCICCGIFSLGIFLIFFTMERLFRLNLIK